MAAIRERFNRISTWVTLMAGSWPATAGAYLIVLGWLGVSLFLVGFGDSSQLVINTLTTVVTFLMVFHIQNTLNRDTRALHLKLDEIIVALSQANNRLVGVERAPEDVVQALERTHEEVRQHSDTGAR